MLGSTSGRFHGWIGPDETRTGRHKGSSYDFLAGKGVSEAEYARYADLGAGEADLASTHPR